MRRIQTLDIEVQWNHIDKIDTLVRKGSSPIQMIGCYDWYNKKYYSFFYHKDVKILNNQDILNSDDKVLYKILCKYFKTKNFVVNDGTFSSKDLGYSYPCRYFYFNNEKLMLNFYMRFIIDNNPDIWNGFFIETFDIPYIINRCKHLNINYSYMSPLHEIYISHGYATIRGSVMYDLPKLYAHFMGSHRYANSLKKVAESHLVRKDGKTITKTSDRIVNEDWYEEDWDRFINYCLTDTLLCVLLEERLGLIEKADRFEKFSGVNPLFVTYDSHIIESILCFIRTIYEKNILHNDYKIAFDTKKRRKHDRSAGALVLPSIRGFYITGTIIALDLSKMYPEIIRSLNISVETLVKTIKDSEKHLYNYCKENNVYYKKEPVGFIPFAFDFFLKIRKEVEEERDKFEYGSKEYNEKNKIRQTVKDFVNAVTGQFDYADSVILKPECADSYRLTGQKEIIITRDYSLKFGRDVKIDLEVLYGDTDSVYLWLKDVNDVEIALKIGKEIVKWIHHGFDEYAKQLNLDKHRFVIVLEKVLDVWVSIGKKKKYLGHVLWSDGKYVKEESSLLIKGYESRRSDSSEFTEKVQTEIFGLINRTRIEGWKKIRSKILRKIRIEYPKGFNEDNMFSIGIPKGLKKKFKDYKVTSAHLRGCDYSNKYLGGQFGAGSKPKLIYIKEVIKNDLGYPYTNVICIEDGMTIPKDIFIIDNDLMIEKTVLAKLQQTLDVIGIDRTEITSRTKRKKVSDYDEYFSAKQKKEAAKTINNANIDNYLKRSEKKLKELKKEDKKDESKIKQ